MFVILTRGHGGNGRLKTCSLQRGEHFFSVQRRYIPVGCQHYSAPQAKLAH
jgi:hypothetical protein